MFRECNSDEDIAYLPENENFGYYETYELEKTFPMNTTCKVFVYRRNASNLWEFLPNVQGMFYKSGVTVS